jgi:TolB protein
MAVVLSKDGQPDIYTVDIGSRRLNRLTADPSIDTEPSWSADERKDSFCKRETGRDLVSLSVI